MTIQRRRTGQDIKAYGRRIETDRRGNQQYVTDTRAPLFEGRAWVIPDMDRMQRAEVPGQQEVIMQTIGVSDIPELNNDQIGLWSYIEWDGYVWDIAEPPGQFHGTKRHTRHWELTIRRRPKTIGVEVDG